LSPENRKKKLILWSDKIERVTETCVFFQSLKSLEMLGLLLII